jgi:polysaccharide export outer membrane protein
MKAKYFIGILMAICLFSCKNGEKVIYFQGEFSENQKILHTNYLPVIQKNDLLDIKLISQNKEASALFTPSIENAKSSVTYKSGVAAKGGFLVSQNGEIELPYIGLLEVDKLTRDEAVELIETKLSEYIKNPIIQIQIINFKVTILGDVKVPGTYNVPNEKISIVEAIGIAGDLNITGKRKEIKLIREIDGKRIEISVDFTDKNIFNSDYFFLHQNDIIYVPQNNAKISNSRFSQIYIPILSTLSILLSVLTVIINQ